MTTLSHPRPRPHRGRNALIVTIAALVAAAALVFTLLDATQPISGTGASSDVTSVGTQSQRAITADELRLTHLAEYYESRGIGMVERGTGAVSAEDAGTSPTRGQQADTDRYERLADHHLGR